MRLDLGLCYVLISGPTISVIPAQAGTQFTRRHSRAGGNPDRALLSPRLPSWRNLRRKHRRVSTAETLGSRLRGNDKVVAG